MTRLLLVADTHLPKRAKELPDTVWNEIDRADIVVHAGDWVEPALLDAFEKRANRLVAVWGNNDGAELRDRLPEVARARIEDVRIAVVHETGPTTGREARADTAYRTPICWSSATATSRGTR